MFPNMEKKRLEDLSYLLRGGFSHLPPSIPTTVRICLAGRVQGIVIFHVTKMLFNHNNKLECLVLISSRLSQRT
jgi:hypothetical protein